MGHTPNFNHSKKKKAGQRSANASPALQYGAICLRPVPDTEHSPFGQAMESVLKGWGYAVVTDQKTDGGATLIPLAYVVEPFEGQVLARLSTKGVEFGRAYTITAQGASPASPLSVMRRG